MAAIGNEELGRVFDNGEGIAASMDVSTARRPNQDRAPRRISTDVTEELVRGLDRCAARMSVNRQAVIKIWLTERLEQETERELARAGA